MSFDKNYPNRKDHRKPYRKAKAVDRSCRNHKSCPWCMDNRLWFDRKRRRVADDELRDFLNAENKQS